MKVNDKVIVLDDGKGSRKEVGVICDIVDSETIYVKHSLWGYGYQLPILHMYKKGELGWSGCQYSYMDINKKLYILECEEWATLLLGEE